MARQRGMMALIGALAAGSLYALGQLTEAHWLSGRSALAVAVLAGVFFGGLLVTTGPLALRRSILAAAGVAVGVAALVTWASLRFAAPEGLGGSGLALLSALTLASLPWPFAIAAAGMGWRDYPSLFRESWSIVVRVTLALIFTGIVWLVIYLSQELLGLVGVPVISVILSYDLAPWLITGTVLGLAMAVTNELADVLSPNLVLRLFRLLVPVVLVVMALFLIALPLRGFATIFGAVSSTAVLLAMTAVAVTLVTSALDQEDALAASSTLMLQATRLLAAITSLPAGLAAWALWLRVADHGWTPSRLMAASAVGLGLAYGLAYLVASLGGRQWRERIRQANILMALVSMALAVLWLSALNPEAIAARSQLARIADGRASVAEIDLYALQDWGLAGQAALDQLKERAKTDAPLAARLAALQAGQTEVTPDPAALQRALAAALPLQPQTPQTEALRDRILAGAFPSDLQGWQSRCDAHLPQGGPGCVLVVADFLPVISGDEAMLFTRSSDGFLMIEGFGFEGGTLTRHPVTSYAGALPGAEAGAALIDQLQKAPAALAPLSLNQLVLPGQPGLVLSP